MSYQLRRPLFPLAMKALAWDYKKGKFVSPSWSSFTWNKEGLTSCECHTCGDDMPGKEHSCGLYATFRWWEVTDYLNHSPVSPIILFEISGKSQFYQDIFRSKQLAPYCVIHYERGDHIQHLASYQASEYFEVPIVPRSRAIPMMDVWNIVWFLAHEGEPYHIPPWRTWYEPESDQESQGALSKLSDEWIQHLAQNLLGGEICQQSAQNTSTCTPQVA